MNGHTRKYRGYLDAGHKVDAWIKEIWNFVQNDPQYKNKTSLFITTDHGRGDINKEEWTSHNNKIEDSHEIWFAVMGPDTPVRGEIKAQCATVSGAIRTNYCQAHGIYLQRQTSHS